MKKYNRLYQILAAKTWASHSGNQPRKFHFQIDDEAPGKRLEIKQSPQHCQIKTAFDQTVAFP